MTTRPNNPTPVDRPRAARAADRRGVAMLLALCAVATVTIVTASYVASRESSPEIGLNAVNTVATKWAGESAGDLAVAALESGLDPATVADPKKFMDDMNLAGAVVKVAVTDSAGNPPALEATEVVVTITATKDGMTTTAQRVVKRPPLDEPIGDALDPELAEFGVYASNKFTMESSSSLAPWPFCPSPTGDVNVGLGSTSDADLDLNSTAVLARSRLFVQSTATSALKARISAAPFTGGAVLPAGVPALGDAVPAAEATAPIQSLVNLLLNLVSRTLNAGVYKDIVVSSGRVITLSGSPGYYSCDKLTVEGSGVLLISGDVTIYAKDDVTIQTLGAIELADSTSRLRLVAAKNLTVDNGGVGVSRAVARDANRSAAGASYIDPRRVTIVGLSTAQGGKNDAPFNIKGKSVVCASIHAPSAKVDLYESAGLLGRVAAKDVMIRTGSWILVDASLDRKTGFTAAAGPLYKGDGALKDAVATLLASMTATSTLNDLRAQIALLADDSVKTEPVPGEVTPRTAEAAQAKTWPAIAMALEESAQGDASSKGLLYNLAWVVADVEEVED